MDRGEGSYLFKWTSKSFLITISYFKIAIIVSDSSIFNFFHENLDCRPQIAVYLESCCMALVECVKYGQNMLINYWKFDQIFVKQTKKRGMVPSKNWCLNLSSRLCMCAN